MLDTLSHAPVGASLIWSVLDNPGVIDAVLAGMLFVLAWAGRKVLRKVDNQWANEFLSGIGSHAYTAGEVAGRAYAAKIREAAADGIVTPEERADARLAALDAAVAATGLSRVAKALGISTGQPADDAAARAFLSAHVDRALDHLGIEDGSGADDTVPLPRGRSGSTP